MVEVLFYHLERDPLEKVLPQLVEKSLARNWRCVIKGGSAERLDAIDALLWTFREDSFLAHGKAGGPHDARQPVLLTLSDQVPNGAAVMFAVDGAELPDVRRFERTVYMFDGADAVAVDRARTAWVEVRKRCAGLQAHDHRDNAVDITQTYWQQDSAGRWQKRG
ncbi:MAG: DNA polymerase III subunit chi [Hyphomicrobiaceae bacterium]